MRCDEVAPLLPAMSDGTVVLPSDMAAHVEHCLRCQAELVQHRRVLRALRSMREEVLVPAPGLVTEVLAHIEEAGERIFRLILDTASGARTRSEAFDYGDNEFVPWQIGAVM